MEPVEFKREVDPSELPKKEWAISGAKGRERNLIKTLHLDPDELEEHNLKLKRKYEEIIKNEVRYETYMMDDAEIAIAAYGTSARIAKTAIGVLREKGIRAGLIRPITLFPFPYKIYESFVDRLRYILVVEMSMGQFIHDVEFAVKGKVPIGFLGHAGGMAPTYEEMVDLILREVGKEGDRA